MMAHLVLKLLWLLKRDGVVREHLQVVLVVQVEAAICQNRNQVVVVISQMLAVLENVAPILPVGEIIFA